MKIKYFFFFGVILIFSNSAWAENLIWSPEPTLIIDIVSMTNETGHPQFYIKVPPKNSPDSPDNIVGACEKYEPTGSLERWHGVCFDFEMSEGKVSSEQCKKWFAMASLAYATGGKVRIYYDASSASCSVRGIRMTQ